MESKLTDMYDFKCEVVHHKKVDSTTITFDLYRSAYYEQNKGTKTVKCEFTILPFGKDKFMSYAYAIDDNKKKGVKEEFRGNLLWGFGKSLTEMDMYNKLASYTNLDEVKKDFGI